MTIAVDLGRKATKQTKRSVNILINSADSDEMPLFRSSLFACLFHVFLHMNHDVVNVQIGLILSRLPFILVGSILGFILIDSQPFPCVEHLHSV